MNGAELVIDFLARKGVKQAYGYPGGPVLVLFEAIYKANFPCILTRHEQGAAHAAEGYAKVSGLPGVCFATSGPGATNLVTGLADAQLDSVPILAITGAVARKATGTDAFQEADITGVTRSITKYNYLVMNPDELLPILEEAWDLTTSGRPGPVLVNIPKDLMALPVKPVAGRASSSYVRHRPPAVKSLAMTDKIYAALAGSRKPLLLAGGGCVISKGCTEALRAFMDSVGIPAATTLMGKGAIDDAHPLYLGNLGMHGTPQANVALGTCDLLLVVGSRLSDRVIGDPELYNDKARIVIHADIDLAEIGKNIRADMEIEDDAADFFETMLKSRPDTDFNAIWQEWLAMLAQKKQKYQVIKDSMYKAASPLWPQYVVHEVARSLQGQNPVVVTDVGQHQQFVAQHYPIESPRSFITSGGLGTMGFGLPAAIGAAAAAPDRTVVLFVGDGGFQMTIQELGLLAKLKSNVKIFIMDNGCLGMVHQWQELFFQKHYSCSILDNNPDFLKIADAYGLPGGQAGDGPSLDAQIRTAMSEPGPYIVHCILDPRENVYPMIPAGKLPQDLIMPGMED
jgi:acetolactate synthase I/II/III large subunit